MIRVSLVFLLLATAAFGQRRNYGSPSGFGNILFPGVGTAPPVNSITGYPGFARGLGTTVGGWPPYTGAPARPGNRPGQPVPGHGRDGRGGRGGAVPYYFPVYVGGWGGGYVEEPAPQLQPVTVVNQPAPSPPVVINQYYGSGPATQQQEQPAPTVGVYQAPATPRVQEPASARQPAEDPKPTIYLIAFRDQTIQPALGYWIEGDTLHYISRAGSLNQASMELVDRAFSRQLNRERNLEFDLPEK